MKNEVEVVYTGGIRRELDKSLEKAAKLLGGRLTGAGFFLPGGGERDLSFEFKRKDNSETFQITAQLIIQKFGGKVNGLPAL